MFDHRSNTSDPLGTYLWLAKGRCPGQPSPVGITAEVGIADAFIFDNFAGLLNPMSPAYTTSDGKHINSAG